MSVQARSLYDGRNGFILPDGSVGYRCCGGMSSVPLYTLQTAFPSQASAIRQMFISQGVNPDELWCRGCSTALEDLRDSIADAGPMIVSMLATVASFIPGIGTAVAAVLGAGLALAEGEEITDAFVAGLKAALPGGMVAEMAFNAGQAALKGESIQDIAIDTLPIPDTVKTVVKRGLEITLAIADGQAVSKILLDQAYQELPEYAQRATDIALALNDGRSPASIIVEQTQRDLPPQLRVGLVAGMSVGHAQALQAGAVNPGPTKSLGRIDTSAENTALARKGQMITSGILLLQQARRMSAFPPQIITNDNWRRGFDIGVAVAQGNTDFGPGQDAIRKHLTTISEYNGFDAASKLQYKLQRDKEFEELRMTTFGKALGRVTTNTAAVETANAEAARQGAAIAAVNPVIASARSLNPSGEYRRGFDIATVVSRGSDVNGPGQMGVRATLGPQRVAGPGGTLDGSVLTQAGFDAGQALQFGITRTGGQLVSVNPDTNAGHLIATGLPNNGQTVEQKVNAATATIDNPAAKDAAAAALDAHKGFFRKVAEFFGLA